MVYTEGTVRLPPELEHKILELIGMPDLDMRNQSAHTKRINDIRRQMYKLSDDFANSKTTPDKYSDAYFAYNFPMNFMKAMIVAEKSKTMYPEIFSNKRSISLLDVGCGEGAGMFGLYYNLKDSIRFSLNGIDASRLMLERCREIAGWLKKDDYNLAVNLIRRTANNDLYKTITQKYDIVIFANSLAEIAKGKEIPLKFIERITRRIGDDGLIIIIEPALRKLSRRLMDLRCEIVKSKTTHVLLPCLHADECPLIGIRRQKEWCHQSISWKPPDFMEILNKGLNRDIDYLKFSYLIVSKSEYKRNFDEGILVISHLLKEKGKKRCFLCTPTGRTELVKLNTSGSHANAEFDKIKKGDVIIIENYVKTKPKYWQITEDTGLRILQHQRIE